MSNLSSTTPEEDNSFGESDDDFITNNNTNINNNNVNILQHRKIPIQKEILPSINENVNSTTVEIPTTTLSPSTPTSTQNHLIPIINNDINVIDGIAETTIINNGISPMASFNEERMRMKLQFFFMNPIEKWQTRRRFPYKFVVQVIKIILVTMQLCLFAHSRYTHVNYTWDNRVSFSHLFLRGWDATLEVESYPPATGPLALYVQDDFFATIDYAVDNYSNLSVAIGTYSYPNEDNSIAPLKLCLYRYKEGTIFGFNESYIFNSEIDKCCVDLTGNIQDVGVKQYLLDKDIQINFSALVKASLKFSVKTVNFRAAGPIAPPDCYRFDIEILFDNRDHDGQMLLSLEAEPVRLHCKGNIQYITDSELDAALRSLLNVFVILICLISFALCTRAIYRAQLLRIQTVNFFRITYDKDLSFEGKMEFINFWYIMIICNDVLLVIGSAMKEQIERSYFTGNEWNICSVLLGIGNLLVWFGVLRYLGFFKTYNVVILTLKRAAPKIFRFLLCALLIYAGFTFCGWLILSPYHIKFRSLATTSECLFSLINGDDMFATFSIMSSKSNMLWWFSRLYLYSFISLYIYVVLSLFISVIMDAYDTIKKYYKDGFPLSDLKQFIGPMRVTELNMGAYGGNDDEPESDSLADVFRNVCCCGRHKTNVGPTGYTSLNPKA